MKHLLLFIVVILMCCQNAKSQEKLSPINAGTFFYKAPTYPNDSVRLSIYYNESLILCENGQFMYSLKLPMGGVNVHGNWQQRGDFLILDSYPQRDKLIVTPLIKRKQKETNVTVVNKGMGLMTYHLTVVTSKGDTVCYKDQWEKTKIDGKISSFWIMNTMGLVSPIYKVHSENHNVFNVIFEDRVVFENEHWRIIDNETIKPIGLNGKEQWYTLKREL